MYVDLSKLPTPNTLYSTSISGLYGGLNLNKTAYDIRPNQCSDMQNMIWKDGVLRGRAGLEQIGRPMFDDDETSKPFAESPPAYVGDRFDTLSAFGETWHDRIFFQTNVGLYYVDMRTKDELQNPYILLQRLYDINEGKGSWFHFLESLYFKGRNCYYKIDFNIEDVIDEQSGETTQVETITCNPVVGYVPVIQINTQRDGVGDRWQPENRMSSKKEVWFTADPGVYTVEIPCDGVSASFQLQQYINWRYENGYEVVGRTGIPDTSATVDGSVFFYNDFFRHFGIKHYKIVSSIAADDTVMWSVSAFNADGDGNWKLVGMVANDELDSELGVTLEGFSAITSGTTVYIDVNKKAEYSIPEKVDDLFIGATQLEEGLDYSVDSTTMLVTMLDTAETEETRASWLHTNGAPKVGTKWTVRYEMTARTYHFPLSELDDIDSVVVNGVLYTAAASADGMTDTEYYPDKVAGTITFNRNLGTYGASAYNANLIHAVYTKRNQDAMNAFENCTLAYVYGGSGIEENVVVLSGITAQPNAFLWSGNDLYGCNPAYFPIENYNLVGEYYDEITGFGRQQDKLVIFQKNRVSSATFSVDTIDERSVIRMNVKAINATIGCDRPGTIQLCDNNLVWAHSRYGICYLKDSTYAYETLVEPISQNIDKKLKDDLANDARLSSADHDGKYWLFVGGNAYVWDYEIQPYTANHELLCFFYLTGFASIAAILHGTEIYFLHDTRYDLDIHESGSGNSVYLFTMKYGRYKDIPMRNDQDEVVERPIGRYFTPQLQLLGGFDRLKDVRKAIFSMPTDRHIVADVIYNTDYTDDRSDKTIIDNEYEVAAYEDRSTTLCAVRVRKPKCRHIHQFALTFESHRAESDLAIDSIQLFYTYGERTKSGVRM